jgi:RHS repeat-associated protein
LNGNETSTTDAGGFVTTNTYGSFSGCQAASGAGFLDACAGLYLTDQTVATGTTEQRHFTYDYDFSTGVQTVSVDADNGTAKVTSYDAYARPSKITEAGLRETNIAVDDTRRCVVTWRDFVSKGDKGLATITHYDQLGRTRLVQELEAGGSAATCADESAGIKTQYSYRDDSSGVYELHSNPYRALSDATMGWTRTSRDTLGRVIRVETFAGATPPAGSLTTNSSSTGMITTSYADNTRTIADQANVARTLSEDGLGRLESVTTGGIVTSYRYTARDELSKVCQNGTFDGSGNCSSSGQLRTFEYTSLGRLKNATNPESGTVAYTYDDNGNLHTRTDAAGVITTYGYDGLNRLKSKSYSDGTTPSVSIQYDSLPYSKGRETQITAQSSISSSTNNITEYDALGRVLGSNQITSGYTYGFRYEYNLADLMTSEQYPSGRKVVFQPDGMNRVNSVRQEMNGQGGYYASGIQYTAHGGFLGYTMGNQVQRTFGYNSRLQLGSVTDTLNSAALLSLTNTWTNVRGLANNGNLYGQTIVAGGFTFSQTFLYDRLNRLSSAQESNHWVRNFDYDAFGNMYVSSSAGSLALSSFTPTSAAWFDASNRLTNTALGISFDSPGNLKTIGDYRFGYDAENRQTSATLSGIPTINYQYDGDGRRVQKTQGAQTINYVYDAKGELAAEYRVQAETSPCTTCYISFDHLGSTRMVTDSLGQALARRDYLPFGEEITGVGGRTSQWGATDTITQKFTAKERDQETGLDYFGARYMSAMQGRFMSPDAFYKDSHVDDPQSWNEYAYARNNPLRYLDPNGESATVTMNCTAGQNHTTCQVSISASIAVYSANGANLSQQQLSSAASQIQSSIQSAWSGSFTQNGVTYNVSTAVSVQIASSQDGAMQSGAQNVIGLSNGNAAPGADSFVNPRSLWTAIKGGPDTGIWNFNNLGSGVAAHEFTHLLGTGDKPGMVLSNTNLLNDPSIPHTATARDFQWGIQETSSGVNTWMNAPPYQPMRYGELWNKPSGYTDRTTVGAPLLWWK